MSFSHDASTDRGKVRLLVYDTVEDGAAFSDAEIDAFLEINSDSIWLAAADASRSLAARSAPKAFMLRLEGALQIDKKKIPEFFLSLAIGFERRSSSSVDGASEFIDSFDISISSTGIDNSEYIGDI